MSKIVFGVSIGLLFLSSAGVAKLPHHRPPSGTSVVVYEGYVESRNAARLTKIVSNDVDKIIGLKLQIAPSLDSDRRYYISTEGDQLNITTDDALDANVEVLINGGLGTSGGMQTIDGFYLIKSGGMHAAGVLSYGLMPVDESRILLATSIKIRHQKF